MNNFNNQGNSASTGSSFLQNPVLAQYAGMPRLNLDPIEFLCQHHDIVIKVNDYLNRKHGRSFSRNDREQLQKDDYPDLVRLLADDHLLPPDDQVDSYIDILFADIFGYGVLECLLYDEEVDEIIVNTHDNIYVEIGGVLMHTPVRFPSVENAKSIVDRIIMPLNKRLDTSSPNVDAQLEDGSRLSASIAPLRADHEISINIRKFAPHVEPLQYYVEKYGSQAYDMAQFLEDCIECKQSTMVSGGTGSGKTTLLNSLSISIPENERIITIEDTLELQLQQPHVERYQTIEPNMEGKGGYSMQQVIIAALRKRPDRIIVGECRGPEIVEMLNAMNTGHDGSLSTVHANSPEEMLIRCATMIRSNPSSAHLSERSIADSLSTIRLIVQTSRLADGSRKIMNITEVVGVGLDGYKRLADRGFAPQEEPVPDKLYVQDIFRFRQTGRDASGTVHGVFETTGYVPYIMDALIQNGFGYTEDYFYPRILEEV